MGYKIKKIYLGEDLVWPHTDPITEAGIYHNADLGLLSAVYIVDSGGTINPNNVQTFSDKNLGATAVWNYGDTPTAANTGTFYQWGNNYGFPYNNASGITTSTSLVDTTNYGPSNYYSSSTFIINGANDWTSDHNRNLWGGTTSNIDLVSKKGPCETGWHVPTAAELTTLTNMGQTLGWWGSNSDGLNMVKALLLPNLSGYYSRNQSTGNLEFNIGSPCVYWCCQDGALYQSAAYGLGVGTNWILYYGYPKAAGYSIRPMRNTPVVPDSSWTKIWPTT